MKGTSIFLALAFVCASFFTGNQLTAADNPPIDLMLFDVQLDDRNVIINWVTATEVTTDVFNIERSLDGTNFSIMGSVDAAGSSIVDIKYFFMDVLDYSISGTVYYRFSQVDLDGTTTASSIKSVTAPAGNILTPVLLNPVTVDLSQLSDIIIHEGTTAPPKPFVNIFDLNGKLVHSKKQEVWGQLSIPQNLPKGYYIVDIRNKNTRFVTRFIKA